MRLGYLPGEQAFHCLRIKLNPKPVRRWKHRPRMKWCTVAAIIPQFVWTGVDGIAQGLDCGKLPIDHFVLLM